MPPLLSWIRSNCRFARKDDDGLPRTVSVAVFRRKGDSYEVLVGKRKGKPSAGEYALPGGHVDAGEAPAAAAARELAEETGIDVLAADLLFVEKPESQRIDSMFCVLVDSDQEAKGASDVKKTKWIQVDDMPELAFDHEDAIRRSLKLIRK
jgi:8-oxo-dGTP diphosphatase